MNRFPALASFSAIWLLLLPAVLNAHSGILNVAKIKISQDAMIVTTEVALREILLVHGLRDDRQGGIDADAVRTAVERHEQYITQHFEVNAMGEKLTGRVLRHTPPPVYTSPSQTKYMFQLRYAFGDLKPPELTLRQNMLREFSVTGGHPWHVTYLLGVTQADGKSEHVSLSPSQDLKIRTGLAPMEGTSAATVLSETQHGLSVGEKFFNPAILIALAFAAGITFVVLILRKKKPQRP